MKRNKAAGFGWLFKMAFRDSKRNRSRLFLFISSVLLGIASLVAVYSLSDILQKNVDIQAANLLGADFEIDGNKPASDSILQLMQSFVADSAEEWSFPSMAYFPSSGGSRLIQVRALKGAFPFYGELETKPATAGRSFQHSQQALVEKSLLLQFDAIPGDSVQIGDLVFEIAGELNKAPGQTGFAASVAPVVYIPLNYLPETGLTEKGSRINYKYFFKFKNGTPSAEEVDKLNSRIEELGYDLDTVESQKRQTGRVFDDLTQFLSLVSFIALLLGCIGVAGAIHVYTREKYPMIAVLRCLGASSRQAFGIFLIQVIGIGLTGAIAGAILGTLIQYYLPVLLQDLIPMKIESGISWKAIMQGLATGLFITVLFSLLPLLNIRKISPLNTLRASFEKIHKKFDPWRVVLILLIFIFLFVFSALLNNNYGEAIIWVIGISLAFIIFYYTARLLIFLLKRFFPAKAAYTWRQGLSNLFRPNNQTVLLVVAIGFGTCFIMLIFFLQTLLMERINLSTSDAQPNMVIFDIRNEQKDSILSVAKKFELQSNQIVPIVNMRLESIKSQNYLNATADSGRNDWLFNREYRATFRDSLTQHEKITAGKWYENKTEEGNIFISLDEGWATRNNIQIGDTMVFNLQGVLLNTRVGSYRSIDWNSISTNFLVVFPDGVLENAPQFHVFLTRINSEERSVAFQKEIVSAFPNVSIIDIGLVLSILKDLFDKVGFIIGFIAGFSILTGLVVLLASVLISKFQRIRESVLLRTLGASGKKIFQIAAIEYLLLGMLSAATGIIIALIAGWLLAKFSFDTVFHPPVLPIVIIFVSVSIITMVTGMLNIRQVIKASPLKILRSENN